MSAIWNNSLAIALEVAPWLLAGLALAGVIKGWIPERRLAAWLGGPGIGPIVRGAVMGAPLPLCSCGAVPAGVTLHRNGASRGAATAFLVGTPGIGIDSVALTYALLGPFMALVRAAGAVASAVTTGVLVALAPSRRVAIRSGSCEDGCCGAGEAPARPLSAAQRTTEGLRYAFGDVLRDVGPWMLVGIVLAGTLVTWVAPNAWGDFGSGWKAMLVMAVIGIPLYLCAQAATPIAAAMILAGVSPGTALVFLLAAPMTSLATLAVLRKEFGFFPVAVFVASLAGSAIAAGLAVDAFAGSFAVNVTAQVGRAGELFPQPVQYLALATLLFLAALPVLRLPGEWKSHRN